MTEKTAKNTIIIPKELLSAFPHKISTKTTMYFPNNYYIIYYLTKAFLLFQLAAY